MLKRLPRRVYLGKGYYVAVMLASKTALREAVEDEDADIYGAFMPVYGWPKFGDIYILKSLPASQKWETYWHELVHAVNDLMAWDRDHPLQT